MLDAAGLYALGFALVAVGIIVIAIAIVISSTGGSRKGKASAAGVIMIGPIPIIFGTDKKAVKGVLALALALTVTALIVLVVYWWFLS